MLGTVIRMQGSPLLVSSQLWKDTLPITGELPKLWRFRGVSAEQMLWGKWPWDPLKRYKIFHWLRQGKRSFQRNVKMRNISKGMKQERVQ